MSKESLYVPKNAVSSSLVNIIDARIASGGGGSGTWNPNAVETLTNKNLTSGTNTFPTSLVTLTGSQTLNNKTISQPIIANPIIVPDDFGDSYNLLFYLQNSVDFVSAQTLTNKNLTSTTNTFPSSLATLTGSQTLTNKTLTNPIISTITNGAASLTLPTSTSFLLGTGSNWTTIQGPGISLVDGTTVSASNQFQGITFRTGANTINDTFSTVGQGSVSDMFLAQRTLSATNTAQVYTNYASLWINGPGIAGTNVTITNNDSLRIQAGNLRVTSGRLLSSALGTAAAPAFAVGTLLNDGIYSSAAGSLNIATAGVLRATVTSSGISFATNYAITTSGTGTITSGSGGFTSAGPLSSTLASSATACSVRPTGQANTGIYGTGTTVLGMSVGGIAVLGLTTAGCTVAGLIAASGVTNANGGLKVNSGGTTLNNIQQGSVTTTSLSLAQYNGSSVSITFASAFSTAPSVYVSLQNVAGSVTNGDNLILSIGNVSTTGCTVYLKNPYNSTVSGTATISYLAIN